MWKQNERVSCMEWIANTQRMTEWTQLTPRRRLFVLTCQIGQIQVDYIRISRCVLQRLCRVWRYLAFIPFAEPWSIDIELGYMNLQRLHRMLLRAVPSRLASCSSGYINDGGTAGFSTDRNANKHHVEGDRHDRHDLVNQSSVLCSTKGV